MKSELKAGVVLSYISLFINSTISIIYIPVMLNLLGQSEYGLYSLAGSAVAFIGILNFGLGSAVIRYTSKYKALKDEDGCSNLYGMFCVMYGILGILALILGVILLLNSHLMFSSSLSIEEVYKLKKLLAVMIINVSLMIGFDFFNVIAQAHEKFIFQKVIIIVSAILNPMIMIPLLMMGYGSVSMAIVFTVFSFMTTSTNIYYGFRVLKIKITFKKFEISLLKEIILFSSFLFLNLIIEKIYWSTHPIILGIFSGTVAISIYTIGASFSGYFSGFSAAISNVFLSKVSGMASKQASDKVLSDLFIRIGRLQYIIISFGLSGFIIFGQQFINLWVGEEYRQSYSIAIIILVPMLIPLIQGMGGIILQAKNMLKFRSILYLAIAIVNVVLSIIFVQWWGAIGCALATAIAFTIGNVIIMNIYYWKKVNLDIPKFWFNILGMSVPFIISLVFGVTINIIVSTENWIVFLVKIIVFAIVYILLTWFTGMNKFEKDLLAVPLNNIMNKFRKGKGGYFKVS